MAKNNYLEFGRETVNYSNAYIGKDGVTPNLKEYATETYVTNTIAKAIITALNKTV